MANDTAVPLNRTERVLATMIGVTGGLAILAMVAMFVGGLVGADLGTGAWPIVTLLPPVGLAVAFVLIVTFLVLSVVRRARLARDGL